MEEDKGESSSYLLEILENPINLFGEEQDSREKELETLLKKVPETPFEKCAFDAKLHFDLFLRNFNTLATMAPGGKSVLKSVPKKEFHLKELVMDSEFNLDLIWNQINLIDLNSLKLAKVVPKAEDFSSENEAETLGNDESMDENDYEMDENDYEMDSEDSFGHESGSQHTLEDEELDADEKEQEDLEEYDEPLEEEFSDDQGPKPVKTAKNPRKTEVDDDFFSLEEMERFAEMGEAQDIKMANILNKRSSNPNQEDEDDEKEDDEDIFSIGKDLATGEFDFDLEDDEDEDNANDIRYEDFFVAPSTEKRHQKSWNSDMAVVTPSVQPPVEKEMINPEGDASDLLGDPEESEIENEQVLSTFEKSQRKLQETIKKLEQENLAEKEWTMKGEVNSKARPVNSILEQDLDVEIAAKPAPVITEETTQSIADLIIQRIKDKAFDDVERKAPPKDSVFDPNRRWELDDEKSKKSLGQIYEEEYQKNVMQQEIKSTRTVQMEKDHQEIAGLMTNLFENLDALSNWHYTPKPAEFELEVIPASSVPAIAMEEVIPAHVSSAQLAAPKEVYDGKVAKSQSELEKSEKNKLRVKAKRKLGAEKKSREAAKKLTGAGKVELQHQTTKKAAIKQLMGQSNVTMVVNSAGERKMLGKGQAGVVQKGEKLGKKQKTFSGSMLKL